MDAATASEAKDVAQAAPPGANAHRSVRFPHGAPPPAVNADTSVRVFDSPVAAVAGARAQPLQGSQTQHQESKEEDDATWLKKMRGWLIVVAVQIASSTYQVGLNTPRGFSQDGMTPNLETISLHRYNIFFYSNMTAFVTSLAIIILVMNKSFYKTKANKVKVAALVTIVVLDMLGLMAAYWASTTAHTDHTAKYTLMVTIFVLFVVYVVFTVQLLNKLKTLGLAFAAGFKAGFDAVWRAHPGGEPAATGGAAPGHSQIDYARSSSQRAPLSARRRGSRLAGTDGATC